MRKLIILAICFLITLCSVHAQDVMVRRNGTEIKGKVTEVGIDRVTYKMSSNLNGANFVIRKSELKQIEFENGETVLMNSRFDPRRPKLTALNMDETFGRHMLRFSPFKVLDSGPGIDLSYEILVDKGQHIGIILPVSIIFPDSYALVYGSGSENNSYFYASPGLKIYPFGQKKVTYAVGPNIFTGFGKIRSYESYYDDASNTYSSAEVTRKSFRMGIIVNNYVNFQITQKFQIGLNAGLGSRYIDHNNYNGKVSRNGIEITGEFNFNLGYRF